MVEDIKLPDKNLIGILQPSEIPLTKENSKKSIEKALENPIGSPPLEDLITPASIVSIVVDDITRPTPTKDILEVLLNKLRSVGVPQEKIKITIGNGMHRRPTQEEMGFILGEKIRDQFDVASNDARDDSQFVYLGDTGNNTPLFFNRRVVEADLVLTTGIIKPHSFAGFTGGAKSILPGVSSKGTILANHRYDFVDFPQGTYGDADASFARRDMEEAARRLPVFILNVVKDAKGRVVGVFAGDVVKAHRQGVKLFEEIALHSVHEVADIIFMEGNYASSQTLYQALGGIDVTLISRKPVIKEGGMVVLLAQCREGFGSKILEDFIPAFHSPSDILNFLKHSPPEEDQWSAQRLAYYLTKIDVAIVTNGIAKEDLGKSKMSYFSTMDDALHDAFNRFGQDMRIMVIRNPDYLILNVK
jgi:nickel-dependent lactate racemase